MNKGVVFMGMGFELVGLVIGAMIMGPHLENHFAIPKGLGVGGLILLLTAGWFWHLAVLMKKFMEEPPDDQRRGDGTSS